MADTSPPHKQTRTASASRAIVAALKWDPILPPAAYKVVKSGAIVAFAVDVSLLVAVHYRWLDRRWSAVREWEDVGAMFLIGVWVTQSIRRRRKKRTSAPPP